MKQKRSHTLDEDSRVAVIGGGPAGSFFTYFILQMANRIGMHLSVDIYEKRDFSELGPTGCNMCGGVINESLVQSLSIEGIELPPDVIQRGIDSFYFHTERDTVVLNAPFQQMRIATVYRGAGPKGANNIKSLSFDGYLLELAINSGANLICERVTDIIWKDDKPQVQTKSAISDTYDLIVGAIGVNTQSLDVFEKLGLGYRKPNTRKTCNLEFELGAKQITESLGNSMHAFLLNIPKLDFAAIIPKGDYVTVCLIGDNISSQFVDSFLQNQIVNSNLKTNNGSSGASCRCSPLASLGDAYHPFGDRVVLLGDCAMARLNKDGIGSAYRVGKVVAATALFTGISAQDFQKEYWPYCRAIVTDNRYGKLIFKAIDVVKKSPLLTRAIMRMARYEQKKAGHKRRISMVLWDMFTGSSPYRDIFLRCLHPLFLSNLVWNIFTSLIAIERLYDEPSKTLEESFNE